MWCRYPLLFLIVCFIYVPAALAANDFLAPSSGETVYLGNPFEIRWENLTDRPFVTLHLQQGEQQWTEREIVAGKPGPSLVDVRATNAGRSHSQQRHLHLDTDWQQPRWGLIFPHLE